MSETNTEVSLHKVNLKCKVCMKIYTLGLRELHSVPIWNLENCSIECHKTFSPNKLLNLKHLHIKNTLLERNPTVKKSILSKSLHSF